LMTTKIFCSIRLKKKRLQWKEINWLNTWRKSSNDFIFLSSPKKYLISKRVIWIWIKKECSSKIIEVVIISFSYRGFPDSQS
jgi:hypothetical protein